MPEPNELVKGGSQIVVRQDLVDEVSVSHDMSVAAAAAEAKAEIEARIIHARKFPRNIDIFDEAVCKDCKRSTFADVALFRKPVGKKKNEETGKWEQAHAVDFSIRFVETALQHYQHIHVTSRVSYDDADKAKIIVGVIDVQNNVGYSQESIVEKLVERREVAKGRKIRGMRQNTYGDTVYLVDATKDEFRLAVGAERSKLIRDQGKRLLPRDILDKAREIIEATLAAATVQDPDAIKRKLIEGFAKVGVSVSMLIEYLGQPLDALTPKDVAELRVLWNGLRDGEFTWAEVLRAKEEPAEGEPEQPKKLRDRILSKPTGEAPKE